jgi:hypothetical protein
LMRAQIYPAVQASGHSISASPMLGTLVMTPRD